MATSCQLSIMLSVITIQGISSTYTWSFWQYRDGKRKNIRNDTSYYGYQDQQDHPTHPRKANTLQHIITTYYGIRVLPPL